VWSGHSFFNVNQGATFFNTRRPYKTQGKRHVQERREEGETQEVVKVQELRIQRPIGPEEKSFLARRLLIYPSFIGARGLGYFPRVRQIPVEVVKHNN
jgi:hypothetical protein